MLMSGWRPEVDTGCLPQLLSMLSFEEVSLDLEPISLARVAGQQAMGILLSFPASARTIRCCSSLLLYGCWGSGLRPLGLHGEH